jgi:DNA primase
LQMPRVNGRIRELKSRLQRLNPVQHVDEHLRLFGELVSLEAHARGLREKAAGSW